MVSNGLGRVFVGHDEQSRAYGLRPLLASRIQRKPTFWQMPAGPFPLDQGAEGACTGFGSAHELAAGPIQVPGITEEYALKLYKAYQATDRSMGNNFPDGATTLAAMKTLKNQGFISGYRWAFGIDDVVATICSVGPVCLGIEWRDGMYSTGSDGRVVTSGPVVGGHFITAVAYDVHYRYGPVIGWLNSWGASYGVADTRIGVRGGIGWIKVPDLADILSRDGEAVVPADLFQPQKYFAARRATTFHANHSGVSRDQLFSSREDAINTGLRPCKVCRP
jgi:hypothetical protein